MWLVYVYVVGLRMHTEAGGSVCGYAPALYVVVADAMYVVVADAMHTYHLSGLPDSVQTPPAPHAHLSPIWP
jgi:hypothetical protein